MSFDHAKERRSKRKRAAHVQKKPAPVRRRTTHSVRRIANRLTSDRDQRVNVRERAQ